MLRLLGEILIDSVRVVRQCLCDLDRSIQVKAHDDLELSLGETDGGACRDHVGQDVLHLRLHADLVVFGHQPMLVLRSRLGIVGLSVGVVRFEHTERLTS